MPEVLSFRRRTILWLAVFVAVGVVTRLVVASAEIINVDEASYMVGASEILRGHLPYVAFGDNKPPLIYLYYALALWGGGGIGAVRFLTAVVTVPMTAFAVSAFYGHDQRGITGALLFLTYSAAYTASDMLAVNCEPVMMLPLAWSLVATRAAHDAVRPGRTFVSGLLIGVATLVKYQAGLWIPPLTLAIVVAARSEGRRVTLRSLFALALGYLLPLAVVVLVFTLAGGFEGLFYWNVTHNLEYIQNPTTVSDAVARGASHVLPFLAVTSMLWLGWIRSWRLGESDYWHTLVAGLIGASAAAGVLGLRFFPHYFIQMYVPLAIAAAPWASSLFVQGVQGVRARGLAAAAVTIALVAGWTIVNARRLEDDTIPALNRTASNVAAQLRSDACYDGASLFVWGSAPEFYYHAGLPLATRFFFPEFPLVRYYAGNPSATMAHHRGRHHARRVRHWTRLMNDLRTSPPTYILDTAPAGISRWQYFPLSDYPMLERIVRREYRPIADINGVTIYRRNNCAVPGIAASTRSSF